MKIYSPTNSTGTLPNQPLLGDGDELSGFKRFFLCSKDETDGLA